MLIIGLIGSLATGKHCVADILKRRYDFIVLHFKDFSTDSDETSAKKCLNKTRETWPKNVVVIGIDSFESFDEFRDNPQFFAIGIDGPVTIRYERQKSSSIRSFEEFVRRDDSILFGNENGKSPLIRCLDLCDFRLINDTSNPSDLDEKLSKLFVSSKSLDDLTTTKLLCPNWDDYFLMLASITAAHGNCSRHRVGCVIANEDQRVVATGYNGTPENIRPCNRGGCSRCSNVSIEHGEKKSFKSDVREEESALLEAGRNACRNATIYITHNPCRQCSKKIVQSRIRRVVYLREYSSSLKDIEKLFDEGKIELIKKKLNVLPILRLSSD